MKQGFLHRCEDLELPNFGPGNDGSSVRVEIADPLRSPGDGKCRPSLKTADDQIESVAGARGCCAPRLHRGSLFPCLDMAAEKSKSDVRVIDIAVCARRFLAFAFATLLSSVIVVLSS
jgi:hypothetical protein